MSTEDPKSHEGLVPLVTGAFGRLPDTVVILLAMVFLFFIAGLLLMWSWAS